MRALALSFPQTYEDAPWGFPVFKVGANKLFAWMTEHDERVDVTVKLTAEEREIVELLPWVRRASHVGRYGWVTVEVIERRDARGGARMDARELLAQGAGGRARRRVRQRLTNSGN